MTEVDKAIRYIFVLSMLLILVAYFAGATNLFSGVSAALDKLLLTVTGRNAQGVFSGYPTGGPAPVTG